MHLSLARAFPGQSRPRFVSFIPRVRAIDCEGIFKAKVAFGGAKTSQKVDQTCDGECDETEGMSFSVSEDRDGTFATGH